MEAVLARAGYRVLLARDGAEAVVMSRSYEGPIEVLVSDCSVPGMSGIDLPNVLTKEREEVHPLLLSEFLQAAIPSRYGFLGKPFGATQPCRAIADVLQ